MTQFRHLFWQKTPQKRSELRKFPQPVLGNRNILGFCKVWGGNFFFFLKTRTCRIKKRALHQNVQTSKTLKIHYEKLF